ncbi:hypothetical protein BDV96DRAFT_362767 [Lophiotrema nucula]|uniref:Xylanolytic transcriptional activator regulatory domain-containing protein n=1 Tax=Lophiotrema nucula TaxID=690887 RepID=A0A6A5ZJ02_9PLEO|nr:hypothetical protein BDV96DRAFT_362767 [Lophiotrema nucula]
MSSLPNSSLDRAWLVMFYSIALSNGSTFSSDESIKLNLRSNLWLSFNDARLLLEPNTLSIQALVIMAQYLEEHITPSTYWVLMNKACVMLQALGSTSWRHDRSVQDQRAAVFWRLNFVDKAMALVLSRQPAIHREVAIQTPPPTVSQLLDTQPHRLSGRSSLFYAHYAHQMHLLSHGMAEVWHCVYAPNLDQASTTKEDLESWYTQATDILKAAALTEQPLLAPADAATVDLSLQILDFQYYALLVRLALSSRETMGTQAVSASVKLLRLLPSIHGVAVTGQEIFPFPVWQWLHCPLSAFGLCWGQIVTGMHPQYEENKQLLETIELLPPFFGSLIARNPIAEKLENITKRMIQHASSITQSSNSTSPANAGPYQSSVVMSPTSAGTPLDDFLAPSAEFSLDEMFSMGNDALLNNPFDWFGWDMSGPAAQSH